MDPTDMPPEARRLLASAERRETLCEGARTVWHIWGEGPAIVMLHGGSGSWTHWLRNVPAIVMAGRRAVVPDLPGFGESDVPSGGGDADAIVSPLREGMRSLVGEPPCGVIAFSFGSLVAVLLAAQAPQAVAWLGLVGAPVLPLVRGRGVDLKPWRRATTPREREAVHRHNLAAIMLHRPEAIDEVAVALQAANAPRDRMRRRRLVTTNAFQDALRQVQCRVTAIYGEEDALCRSQLSELRAALDRHPMFQGMAVVPGAGHWVQYEQPEAFNRWALAALSVPGDISFSADSPS